MEASLSKDIFVFLFQDQLLRPAVAFVLCMSGRIPGIKAEPRHQDLAADLQQMEQIVADASLKLFERTVHADLMNGSLTIFPNVTELD